MEGLREGTFWVVGASGGIGAAVATRLRAEGARVIASSRRAMSDPGTIPLDLTDTASIAAAVTEAGRQVGPPDGLVVSAAAPAFGDFFALGDADWRRALDVKLLGTLELLRQAVPPMLARGKGRVVIVTGRGVQPPPHHLPGAGINAALNLIVQGLGRSWAAQGVAINAVAPGPVRSMRLDAMRRSAGQPAAAASVEPEDVAGAVAFLLSGGARAVSGSTLIVDGGGLRTGPAPG